MPKHKKAPKKQKKPQKKKPPKPRKTPELQQQSKSLTKGGKTIRIYGHEVDRNRITNAAVDAHNKRKYTINDIQVHEYVQNPKFHNLMIKIAILDRIEEELTRIYPDLEIERTNAVTIMIR